MIVSVFSPETARLIARYVREELRKSGVLPVNPIHGRWPSSPILFAQIVAGGSQSGAAFLNAWKEVRWSDSAKAWEDEPDGRSGTPADNYLVDVDPTQTLTVDSVYLAIRAADPETGATFWIGIASASLPTGEFQHQSFYMVSQDQPGWSFIRAHGLPS